MTGRYVKKSIPLQVRHMVDQASTEMAAVVQTPPVSDSRQGMQQWAVWSSMSLSSPRSALASCSRTSSVCSVTGNFTDRSSVCSFCEDEFDRQESKKVQELFDAIDVILYENSASGPSHLCHECSEWTSRFPHLRVVAISKDAECRIHEMSDDDLNAVVPSTAYNVSSATKANYSNHTPNSVHLASLESGNSTPRPFSFHTLHHCSSIDEEDGEIIAKEGIIDYKMHSDASSSSVSWLPQSDACDHTSISNSIFSRVWNEAVSTLRPVIQRYAQTAIKAGDPHDSAADILVIDDELHDVDPAAQLAVNQGDLYTASRVSHQPSIPVSGVIGLSHLDGLLMIKTIQARDRSGALADAEGHIGGTSVTRPSSSIAPLSSRNAVKPSERSTSARTKHCGRLKLAPLADRLKTPNVVQNSDNPNPKHSSGCQYSPPGSQSSFQPQGISPPDCQSSLQPQGISPPGSQSSFQPQGISPPGCQSSFQPQGISPPGSQSSFQPQGISPPGCQSSFQPQGIFLPCCRSSFQPQGISPPGSQSSFQPQGITALGPAPNYTAW